MLAEKEAVLVAGLEEFGRSASETLEFALNPGHETVSPLLAQPRPFESTLIVRLKAGEMEAFDQLVEEYQSLVYALALRVLNDAEDARDATQETFLKIYRHFANFRGEASLKTWICRIAINQARSADRWRRRRRRTRGTPVVVVHGDRVRGRRGPRLHRRVRPAAPGVVEVPDRADQRGDPLRVPAGQLEGRRLQHRLPGL